MDTEIEFGEVEQAPPAIQLRPDNNKHYSVVPYGEPGERDLPIFVDVDVMRDMEAHAQSNTGVELGGVLLGGQFEDGQRKPFVVITDSLRAEHYESTKGSFKFTHDTWSKITREREEFPSELQMVGWYHTHPDWGVFLSGMDMFICDNFFNKPLDVALVIDPCRQDRGMFQWTGNPAQRVRRTGGFWLIASRFRLQELQYYAASLEGKLMAPDPRFGGFPQMPAPVVNIADSRSQWQSTAVLGLLAMQFLFLGAVLWRLLFPLGTEAGDLKTVADKLAVEAMLIERQRTFLDQFYGSAPGTPDKLVTQLEKAVGDRDQFQAASKGLHERLTSAERELVTSNSNNEALAKDKERLLSDKVVLQDELKELQDKLASLSTDAKEGQGLLSYLEGNWVWVGVGGAALLILGVGIAMALQMRRAEAAERESDDQEAAEP